MTINHTEQKHSIIDSDDSYASHQIRQFTNHCPDFVPEAVDFCRIKCVSIAMASTIPSRDDQVLKIRC